MNISNCTSDNKCQKNWDSLAATNTSNQRFCSDCKSTVYWCSNESEVTKRLRAGDCIAFEFNDEKHEPYVGNAGFHPYYVNSLDDNR